MEKLIKKFESFDFDLDGVSILAHSGERCAEETKKIAVAFANYYNSSGDCEELFEQFIEEYYE